MSLLLCPFLPLTCFLKQKQHRYHSYHRRQFRRCSRQIVRYPADSRIFSLCGATDLDFFFFKPSFSATKLDFTKLLHFSLTTAGLMLLPNFLDSHKIWNFFPVVSGCVFLIVCLLCCNLVFCVALKHCFFYLFFGEIVICFLSSRNFLRLHEKLFSSFQLHQYVIRQFKHFSNFVMTGPKI